MEEKIKLELIKNILLADNEITYALEALLINEDYVEFFDRFSNVNEYFKEELYEYNKDTIIHEYKIEKESEEE